MCNCIKSYTLICKFLLLNYELGPLVRVLTKNKNKKLTTSTF